MGYRHQMISSLFPIEYDSIPKWFIEKYKEKISFEGTYWNTFCEHKLYVKPMSDFLKDLVSILKEIKLNRSVQLVFFADEAAQYCPDITHYYLVYNEKLDKVEITVTLTSISNYHLFEGLKNVIVNKVDIYTQKENI